MAKGYVPMASNLTTIGFPSATILWAPPSVFEQRNIEMQFACSDQYVKRLDRVVALVTDDDEGCVCVFVGSKDRSYHILAELERKLNEALQTVDVMHVHGSLDKNEKYWFIRFFCAGINIPELRAKILLATAAANVGIDHHLVILVLNLGWTRDLCTYFQQRGRGGRVADMECICIQMGSLQSHVEIVFQIHTTRADAELDDAAVAHDAALVGVNSAISPRRSSTGATTQQPTLDYNVQAGVNLTTCQKRMAVIRARKELLEVLQFHCLNFGCQHVRGEQFMACGELCMPLPPNAGTPCKTKCPICTGEWGKIFRRVHKGQIIRFLESDTFSRQVHLLEVRGDNIEDILRKGDEKWRIEAIYGRKTVEKCNIYGLFLQLTVTGILELNHATRGLSWSLGRSPDPTDTRERVLNYKIDSKFDGICRSFLIHLFN